MLTAAICLSCVAAYYSIVGMTSIFTGALIPIIIMTGILEISKLIVTSWLYNNWAHTHKILKNYLTVAVIVLMFITNIGIFGFLSKANIEQSARAEEQLAQITRIDQQILEQKTIIADIKQQISGQGSIDSSSDSAINGRIADANRVIDSINKRAQTLVDEQKAILDQERAKLDQRTSVYQKQLDDLDHQFSVMSLHQQKINLAQTNRQRNDLNKKIDAIRNAPNNIIDSANAEITKIRSRAQQETSQAQSTVNELTAKLSQGIDLEKSQTAVDQQTARIKTAGDQLDVLNATKFRLQGESRKLDVEVGPLKFIAQMLYGDNVDQKLLEHAVRIVILILIFVFDPLALAMLIAANQGLTNYKKQEVTIEELVEIAPSVPIDVDLISSDNISKDMPDQQLTVESEPVTVSVNEQLDDVIPVVSESVDFDPIGLIHTTEDLLSALQTAHAERVNKYIRS